MVPNVGNSATSEVNCGRYNSKCRFFSANRKRWPLSRLCTLILLGCILEVRGHGVATSHQSVVSGEGWRYGYGIAHGPHGIGHATGESFPHGYGGFGAYAPAYGYDTKPIILPPPPPPEPVVIHVPQYVVPYYYNHIPYGYLYPYDQGHGYYGHEFLGGGYYDAHDGHDYYHHH
ncbi:uncharacterized protein LOC112127353 [Cimex lectularius]|uniref:Uncharacterized protein n=1 Tax=Cimex lectularius TaxID=79782 RepID=A0A8I6SMQ1_CIMLE|nr:uncharacterized protein LOC112127353 [Cimex lectularius]